MVSFLVNGSWTTEETFFTQAGVLEKKTKFFALSAKPSKVKLRNSGNDGWGYWKITVNGQAILESPNFASGSDKGDNPYWIDGDQAPPVEQTYDIPAGATGGIAYDTLVPVELSAHTSNESNAKTSSPIMALLA